MFIVDIAKCIVPKVILRKVKLSLKFHLMQLVLDGAQTAAIFALKRQLTLTKWNTILILKKFWQ